MVDKYERALRVINQDVISFNRRIKFELVVDISAFAHVGWDERPSDPMKPCLALEHIKSFLLLPRGEMHFIVPIGGNPHIDNAINEDPTWLADSMSYLGRLNFKSECDEALKSAYGEFNSDSGSFPPYPFANAIAYGNVYKWLLTCIVEVHMPAEGFGIIRLSVN